ncbi:MAG: hypothetical protein ACFCUU_19160 [Cyclobacteriaceae bacterium]
MKILSIKLLIILMLIFTVNELFSQADPFIGSFINTSSNVSLQLKPVGKEYHGVIHVMQSSFALEGTKQRDTLSGIMYGSLGPVAFKAYYSNGMIALSSLDYNDSFVQVSPEHGLQHIDLSSYMLNATSKQTKEETDDYDFSYSQHSDGYANEQSRNGISNSTAINNSPYQANSDKELLQLITGSQLVYYNRSSYVNDNVASSITYVNFCASGRYSITYDGSFGVSGDFGGNAQGASRGKNSGNWQLINYEGTPAVYMVFDNGNTNINPVNKQNLLKGRWRIGNTQYAFQRNAAKCR